jgi:hypothetical protein
MQIPAETSLHVGCSENALEFQPGRRIKNFLREAVDAIRGRLLSKISIARITTTAGFDNQVLAEFLIRDGRMKA